MSGQLGALYSTEVNVCSGWLEGLHTDGESIQTRSPSIHGQAESDTGALLTPGEGQAGTREPSSSLPFCLG